MNANDPAPATQQTNIAAIVSVVAGGLSLIILPILLAPVAIIVGVVGDQQGRRIGGRRMATAGIVLGFLGLLLMLLLSIRAGNL